MDAVILILHKLNLHNPKVEYVVFVVLAIFVAGGIASVFLLGRATKDGDK